MSSSIEDYGSSSSSSGGKRRTKFSKTKDKFKEKIEDGKDVANTADKIQSIIDDPTKVFDLLGESTDGLITGISVPLIIVIALGAIGSGVASMVLTVSTFVDIASVSLFALAPLVIIQKSKLKNLGGIREQISRMKLFANHFTTSNKKLIKNVNDLQSEMNDLRTCEGELQDIVKTSNDDVDRLLSIMKQQDEVQRKIKSNLENTIMQNVLDAVLSSDTDNDFSFDKKELRRLKTRVTNLPGVEFHEENFDKFCNTQDIIKGEEIMLMFRNLKDPTVPNEDNIFVLRPDQLMYTSHDSKTGKTSDIIITTKKSSSSDNKNSRISPTSIVDENDNDDDDSRLYRKKHQNRNNNDDDERSSRPGLSKGKAQYGSARIHKNDDDKLLRSERPGLGSKGDAKYGQGTFF